MASLVESKGIRLISQDTVNRDKRIVVTFPKEMEKTAESDLKLFLKESFLFNVHKPKEIVCRTSDSTRYEWLKKQVNNEKVLVEMDSEVKDHYALSYLCGKEQRVFEAVKPGKFHYAFYKFHTKVVQQELRGSPSPINF